MGGKLHPKRAPKRSLADAAGGLNAKAFTTGNDVHFGSGQYQPGTKEGDRLLAHELTHVVQGGGADVQRKADGDAGGEEDPLDVSDPGEPAEVEADAAADRITDQVHGGDAGGAAATEPNKPSQAPAAVSRKISRNCADGGAAKGAALQ